MKYKEIIKLGMVLLCSLSYSSFASGPPETDLYQLIMSKNQGVSQFDSRASQCRCNNQAG